MGRYKRVFHRTNKQRRVDYDLGGYVKMINIGQVVFLFTHPVRVPKLTLSQVGIRYRTTLHSTRPSSGSLMSSIPASLDFTQRHRLRQSFKNPIASAGKVGLLLCRHIRAMTAPFILYRVLLYYAFTRVLKSVFLR